MSDNAPILIVGTEPDVCRVLADTIRQDFDGVEFAEDEQQAMDIIDSIESVVLVESCVDIAQAEHLQLSLLRHCGRLHALPHQTLLLCGKNETKAAYEACVKQIFDNYALDKPIYDVHRIYLAIFQARDTVSAIIEARQLRQRIDELRREFPDLDGVLAGLAEQGAQLRRRSSRAYLDLFDHVDAQVGQLGTALSSSYYHDVLTVLDEDALKQRLKQFTKERMKPEFEAVGSRFDHVLDGFAHELKSEAEKSAKATAERQEKQRQEQPPPMIMLVDDEPVYRDVLKISLESAGFEAECSASGAEVLAKISLLRPALVLMDHAMPGMSGIDTTRAIKAAPGIQDIPVIMLTGNRSEQLVKEAMAAGACDYIVKPADRATLLKKINLHIDRKACRPV